MAQWQKDRQFARELADDEFGDLSTGAEHKAGVPWFGSLPLMLPLAQAGPSRLYVDCRPGARRGCIWTRLKEGDALYKAKGTLELLRTVRDGLVDAKPVPTLGKEGPLVAVLDSHGWVDFTYSTWLEEFSDLQPVSELGGKLRQAHEGDRQHRS